MRDDELMHWKYIKRVRKNGKWRYYYDTKSALGITQRNRANARANEYNRYQKNLEGYRKLQGTSGQVKWYSSEKERDLTRRTAIKGKLAAQAYSDYMKTPLGKLERVSDNIKKGRKKVADMLSALGERIRPNN